jgi:hypothetical protein
MLTKSSAPENGPVLSANKLDLANECNYAARDRKVTVNERLVC